MPKRPRVDDGSANTSKKKKSFNVADAVPLKAAVSIAPRQVLAPTPAVEIDFPRGGGSSFTPLESKAIRKEALQELKDEQVFQVGWFTALPGCSWTKS